MPRQSIYADTRTRITTRPRRRPRCPALSNSSSARHPPRPASEAPVAPPCGATVAPHCGQSRLSSSSEVAPGAVLDMIGSARHTHTVTGQRRARPATCESKVSGECVSSCHRTIPPADRVSSAHPAPALYTAPAFAIRTLRRIIVRYHVR